MPSLLLAGLLSLAILPELHAQQRGDPLSSAVDTKGVRHRGNDYVGRVPWMADAIKKAATRLSLRTEGAACCRKRAVSSNTRYDHRFCEQSSNGSINGSCSAGQQRDEGASAMAMETRQVEGNRRAYYICNVTAVAKMTSLI
jgi:hypothetical protein